MMLVGVVAATAGALMALGGFVSLGASGWWLLAGFIASSALAFPAWVLWFNRAAMGRVLDLPDALRSIGELDDDLLERVESVKATVSDRSAGPIGVIRSAVAIVDEARGSLDQELAPFAAAIGTLAPARLAASAFAMMLAGGSLFVGTVIAIIALLN